MDLTKQKTFIKYVDENDHRNEKYYDALFEFCLEKLKNNRFVLNFYDELNGDLEFIAFIDSLEDLEHYYNQSTNYSAFEWK